MKIKNKFKIFISNHHLKFRFCMILYYYLLKSKVAVERQERYYHSLNVNDLLLERGIDFGNPESSNVDVVHEGKVSY